MLGVPGIAARTFAAVHRKGISVSLITQASSEHSICFGVPEAAAEGARASLIEEFQSEIARREIDGVEVRPEHTRRRSEEHTSELQSRLHLVCRLLLEKKKQKHRSGGARATA